MGAPCRQCALYARQCILHAQQSSVRAAFRQKRKPLDIRRVHQMQDSVDCLVSPVFLKGTAQSWELLANLLGAAGTKVKNRGATLYFSTICQTRSGLG